MEIITGDLWNELGVADILFVTTNSTLTRVGRLIMGKGAAKEAAERFWRLPSLWGQQIMDWSLPGEPYLLLLSKPEEYGGEPPTHLGAFQVKTFWSHPAKLDLIEASARALRNNILGPVGTLPWQGRIAMNYPGIGAGSLCEEDVEPVLRRYLAECDVTIYKHERKR